MDIKWTSDSREKIIWPILCQTVIPLTKVVLFKEVKLIVDISDSYTLIIGPTWTPYFRIEQYNRNLIIYFFK